MVICLVALIAVLQNKPSVTAHKPSVAENAADDFNRAPGGLGPDWTNIGDGGLSISSHAVTGRSGLTGDIWTAGTFTSDQYSQIEVTSTQLTGGEWTGTAVRAQHGGRDAYVGIYYWNSGKQELMLFRRSGGSWTNLGSYISGPLAAGTKLKLVAVGDTISFLEDGFPCLTVSDRSLSGGAPGIIIYGAGTVGDWSGGDASGTVGLRVHYMSTDADGVRSYQVSSPDDGPGIQVMRVLAPTHPAPGVPHNFLYALPVQPQLGNAFGGGLETLRRLDAQDQYNLTIIEPTFAIDPWYADNPENSNVRYDTFMTREIVPWVEKNLATTGHEQNWLIGFSKSGLGAQDLILKHPGIFALAASWDFPADMSSYDELAADSVASYGTNANFQANYRLTPAFVKVHSGPFLRQDRIWIGGGTIFPTDISDYAKLLAEKGILFTREAPRSMAHRWDSGWVPDALAALRQDSIEFHGGQS
ncbi:MAG TPA: alpha/beta hydrolase-fold protein [Streptosporangiaceae bacterium]|nr:alpha/beta hydrolase-fold protein [Streptosporangiaceae bacterium]